MRLCMPCANRPGLLLDISLVLANKECEIVFAEVAKGALYLECQLAFEEQKPQIMMALQQVKGISKVSEVPYLPAQERTEQLEAILTSVQADWPYRS